MKLYLNDVGVLCALGHQRTEIFRRLLAGDASGLVPKTLGAQSFWVGAVNAVLPEIQAAQQVYACRNNQLLLAAAEQMHASIAALIQRYGRARIGVVLGTSTSGVHNTELALASDQLPATYHYKQQQMGAGADFLADALGLTGPAFTLSTACSSSGKAFAAARRLIRLDYCDAVLVGGADSLCGLTIHGFAALESMSKGLASPFAAQRDGINIGEAACLFILSREPGPVSLAGIGASSDAYHFSAPDPAGTQVINAMQTALADAALTSEVVDYVNLHGTATVLNDAMESTAVAKVFGQQVAVSSTKGMTGHTLGAAAALELAFCWLLLTEDNPAGLLPPNHPTQVYDPNLPALAWVKPGQGLGRRIQCCQSNSFAFGGSNVSIVVTRV